MRSSTRSSRRRARLSLIALVLALVGAGCTAAATPAPTLAPTPAAPVVSGAWVRPPMGADRPAAGYLTIANPGSQADALIAAASAISMTTEIHETTTMSGGMSGMQPVAKIEVPAGETVELKPGGYHLMFMNPKTLTVGDTVDIELTFEKAGKVTIQAEVKAG
jgi:copper(I)-binding protein